jgi:bacillopeptidase F (M6 metalloprotease family)
LSCGGACVAGTDGVLVEIDDLPLGIDGVLCRIDSVLGRIDDVLDEIDGDGVFTAADSVAPN